MHVPHAVLDRMRGSALVVVTVLVASACASPVELRREPSAQLAPLPMREAPDVPAIVPIPTAPVVIATRDEARHAHAKWGYVRLHIGKFSGVGCGRG